MKIILEQNNPEPLYLQIKDRIKDHIIKNKLEKGTRLPSINQVASDANVCIDTIQKAFEELVKEGICYKRPKKGTFVGTSNIIAKKSICLIYHYLDISAIENNISEAKVHQGLTSRAKDKHIDILFITHDPEETITFYKSNREFDLKGVFVISMTNLDKTRTLAEKFPSIKFVSLSYNIQGFEEMPSNVHGIFFDNFAGGYQMTQHLIDKGHSRIAVVSKEMTYQGYHRRIAGYRQALADNGLKFNPELVFEESANSKFTLQQIGRKYAETICQLPSPPTAIFCVNDYIAAGIKELLTLTEFKPQIEVCGYDNLIPELSINYRFNTMSMDFETIGRKGIDIIASQNKPVPKTIKLMPQILLRGEHDV